MIKRFLLTFALVLAAMLVAVVFQIATESNEIGFAEASENIRNRLGVLLAVWIGGALFAASVMFAVQEILNRQKRGS